MKRLLLIFNLLLLSSLSFAQKGVINSGYLTPELSKADEIVSPETVQNAQFRSGAIIYSQDFSNGIPTAWTNTGTPTGAIWEYRGPNTTPDTSVGSRGAYATGLGPIESPTASNGFVIYDSDYYDNAGSTTGSNGPYPAPHEGSLISPVIDLTGHQFVRLQWYQYYRQFNSLFLVLLSTDGGLTFPDTIWNNEDLGFSEFVDVNQQSANPSMAVVDISNLAGGKSNVVLQWKMTSAGPNPNNAPGYYFWMVDDISIIDKPGNDLAIDGQGIIEINNVGLFYGHIPFHYFDNNQAPSTLGINTGVFVANTGINNQTNTTLNVSVPTTTYSETTTPMTIARDSVKLLSPANAWLPAAPGAYDIVFTVDSDSADAAISDNSLTRTIYITDSVLALDTKVRSSYLGTNSFTTSGSANLMRIANWYEVQEQDTALSVTLGISPASRVGGAIKVQIRDTASTIVSNTIIMESALYELTAADTIAQIVTIPFTNPGTLPKNDYVVVAELYAGGTQALTVRVADDRTIEQPWWASTIQLPSAANTWYSNGNAFHMRLNLKNGDPTGVKDPAKAVTHKLYPNPTKGEANVSYSLTETSDVTISIKDISGKTVLNLNEGRQSAGNYNKSLDLKSLPNGLYIYELKINNDSYINKLVVNK